MSKLFKGVVLSVDKENKEWKNEKAVVVGRLTKDPFISERATVFNIATLGKDEYVEFPKIIIIQEQTKKFAAEHLTKGCMVAVVGNVSKEEYEKKDGTKGEQEVIFCDRLQLVSFPQRKDADNGAGATNQYDGFVPAVEPEEEDLPF